MKPLLYYGDELRASLFADCPVSRIGINPFCPDQIVVAAGGWMSSLDIYEEIKARARQQRP